MEFLSQMKYNGYTDFKNLFYGKNVSFCKEKEENKLEEKRITSKIFNRSGRCTRCRIDGSDGSACFRHGLVCRIVILTGTRAVRFFGF